MRDYSEMPEETFQIEDLPVFDGGEITETNFGVWQTRVDDQGKQYREFISYIHFLGWPLLNYTCGIHPTLGKRKTAKGWIAIGRKAIGFIAIGHAAAGVIAIGQLAIGILLGLGQLSTGVVAIGQGAIAVYFALGQFAYGHIAIAQLGYGEYVLAQLGWGEHVWDTRNVSPVAQKFFRAMWSF